MPYEICVKTRAQQIITFDVEETNTVGEVKKLLQDKTGTADYDQLPLYFNAKELTSEDATLVDLGIVTDGCPGGPILQLGRAAEDAFDVLVQLPDGGEHRVMVSPAFTVAQLKARLTQDLGIPFLMIKLYYDYVELTDSGTMLSYKLPAEAKVQLRTKKELYAGPHAGQKAPTAYTSQVRIPILKVR